MVTKLLFLIFLSTLNLFFVVSLDSYATETNQTKEPIYVISNKGIIDLGLSAYIRRSLKAAKDNNAKVIILEIDTVGGRVDAALEICEHLEKIKPISTIAFIDDKAWSAGALISLACEKIIVSPGSSIGSAEPRAIGFNQQNELTDEKVVSAIRTKFKALAEQNNHPINLALSMVDKDFEIKQVKLKNEIKILTTQEIDELKTQYKESEIQILKTISPKGKLLNLTAKEAKEFGLAEEVINNRDELIKYLGFEEKSPVKPEINWSEILVRFITHPLISPLLLTLGFLGLIFELKIPGWGLSGTLGAIFLALFFWGHYLAGLANWTEIVIFIIGLILLFLEIFIIPGFGIAGISGITLILGGIFLALIKYPLHLPSLQLAQAFSTLGYTFLFTVIVLLIGLRFLSKNNLWRSIILTAEEKKETGFLSANPLDTYLGKVGKTISILRPGGKVSFSGEILDVISQGEFIEKDKTVKVIDVQSNKVLVKET